VEWTTCAGEGHGLAALPPDRHAGRPNSLLQGVEALDRGDLLGPGLVAQVPPQARLGAAVEFGFGAIGVGHAARSSRFVSGAQARPARARANRDARRWIAA